VLGQALRQALIGLAIGSVLALGANRIIASNVRGMPVFDAAALAAASLCVFSACMFAALLPSRRAVRTDPSGALRHD